MQVILLQRNYFHAKIKHGSSFILELLLGRQFVGDI